MPRAHTLVTLLSLSSLASLALPAERAAAQADVRQVCVSGLPCVDLPNVPMLRRSVTNYVKFKGNLIDHVAPHNILSNRSAVTVEFVKAYPCDGLGCVEARVTVRPDISLDDKVTLEFMGGIATAFSSGKVTMSMIRGGEITGVAQLPAPGNWGEGVAVTLTGRDIGNAKVVPSSGAITNLASGFDRITFTHVASGTATTAVSFKVSDAGLPLNSWMFDYRAVGDAAIHNLKIDYRPLTATPACIASTTPTVPQPTSPPAGSTLAFSNDPEKATVSLAWTAALTSSGSTASTPDTKYEYEVTPAVPTVQLSGVTRTTSTVSTSTSTLLTSAKGATTTKSATVTLARDKTYQWRVRAVQCASTSAPSAGAFSPYSSFTVK